MLQLVSFCCILIAGGGVAARCCGKHERAASKIGSYSCIVGLLIFLTGLFIFRCFRPFDFIFPLTLCFVGIAAACHAPGYLRGHSGGRSGFFWLCFNGMIAAMAAVSCCKSLIPFLIAWEMMGIFSFFLVAFEMDSRETMKAAWIYLLSCEAGGMLLMFFYRCCHGPDAGISDQAALALLTVAFGLKCGFPLLHVWLPEAHPAAPAPVSAVMSGAMIPLGFLGIFRFFPPGATMDTLFVFGWVLLVLGMIGAFFGILSALVQKDLKRLLACSSVENIGIAAMGFGFWCLGKACDLPLMRDLGLCGAFLHILNHALLKGSLFLCAGSVLRKVRTLNMEKMGGLGKKMPLTGTAFCLSALGLCGLPPFSGFTGEVLIYTAGFAGIREFSGGRLAGCNAAVIVLALTGAVAAAALLKAFGAVFQGAPRTSEAKEAKGEDARMNTGILILLVPSLLMPFAAVFLPIFIGAGDRAVEILLQNAFFSLLLIVITGVLWFLRERAAASERTVGTWDCGFAGPTARMEYTGTGFVQPLLDLFNGFFRQRKKIQRPQGPFPRQASYAMEAEDLCLRFFWKPLFRFVAALAGRVHRFQSGYLHLYILVMTLALALMLFWALGFSGGVK